MAQGSERAMESPGELQFYSCVRGYHVYKDGWSPVRDELLACQRETGNAHDPFAVKVVKSRSIVGHFPKKISSTCSLFLRHGGVITCKITNPTRQYSRDLEQGGLEIPCLLLFQAEQKLLEKARKLLSLSEKSASVVKLSAGETSHKIKQEPEQEANVAPKAKRIKVEHTTENQSSINVPPQLWATCAGTKIKLYQEDRVLVERNQRLNDKHINFAQAMFRGQFPQCDGLQNTLLQGRYKYSTATKMVQILHVRGDHWVVISNLLCPENEIRLYDTVYSDIDQPTKALLIEMFNEGVQFTVDGEFQKQKGDRDCGVFCIAVTTSLLHNLVPGPFVQALLRPHLIHCLENKLMMPFP